MTYCARSRKGLRATSLFVIATLLCPACSTPNPPAEPSGVERPKVPVVVERQKLEKVPAGTVIGEKPPEGWSDIAHFSTATLTPEDKKDAPKNAAFYAQMFRYVLLAKTEKVEGTYQLKKVAAGFAVDIKGKDTVIDSKHHMGAELYTFGGRILAESEKSWEKDVRQVVRTPTMVVIDDRQLFLHDKEHVMRLLRYAILADPTTGRVRTTCWLLEEKGDKNALAETELQLLPQNFRETYALSVRRDKFGPLGTPADDAFARRTIPQGKAIKFPEGLAKLAALRDFREEDARELEKALRDVLPKEP